MLRKIRIENSHCQSCIKKFQPPNNLNRHGKLHDIVQPLQLGKLELHEIFVTLHAKEETI